MSLAIAGIKPGTHFNLGRHHAIRNRVCNSGKCSAACADGVGMKDRPILFSGPMIRALLDGSKTMTRRIVKPDDVHYETDGVPGCQDQYGDHHDTLSLYRYGQPGDRLWVRETHYLVRQHGKKDGAVIEIDYKADPNHEQRMCPQKWRPSSHMPRWASRILLEITSVRVERLQDISEADARAEGCVSVEPVQWHEGMKPLVSGTKARQQFRGQPPADWTDVVPLSSYDPAARTARDEFKNLWQSINGAVSWSANPFVWVIEFQRVQP